MANEIDPHQKAHHYDDAHESLTTLGVPRPKNWSVAARIDWLSEHIPDLWLQVSKAREKWEKEDNA